MLKEPAEERSRFVGDACDLVRRLTIEFEIELGLGSPAVPILERLEFVPPQSSLCQRGPSHDDAHPWRLPRDAWILRNPSGRSDDAAGDETLPAPVLTRENENGVAGRDVLAAVHCFLRMERKRSPGWIVDRGFDHELQRAILLRMRFGRTLIRSRAIRTNPVIRRRNKFLRDLGDLKFAATRSADLRVRRKDRHQTTKQKTTNKRPHQIMPARRAVVGEGGSGSDSILPQVAIRQPAEKIRGSRLEGD